MKTKPEMLADELDHLERINDPHVLISLWNEAKLEISRLLEDCLPRESWLLSRSFKSSFHNYRHQDEEVTRRVIPLFPVNDPCTFKHLGIADDIDEYIITHKLRIHDLSQTKDHGFREVLEWAAKQGRRDLIEQVVIQVRNDLVDNHPKYQSAWNEAFHGMLRRLVGQRDTYIDLSGAVDQAMSDLVILAPDYRKQHKDMAGLARSGMNKTLIKVLSVRGFGSFDGAALSDQDFQCVLNALPQNPTPLQMHWIHRSIEVPGLAEKILFDPSVNMDAYVEAMGSTRFGEGPDQHNLTIWSIQSFAALMTPEHLNTGERRRRARKMLNAVCEKEFPPDKKNPDALRVKLVQAGFNPYVFRLCDQLKAEILQDELGM
jgi:hypothetical protein